MVVKNVQIYVEVKKWNMEFLVKKFKVDISTTPTQSSLHDPYHCRQGRDRLLISPPALLPVKGEDYENLVNFFKTCTLRCLINGAQRLLIFQFFLTPPPPPFPLRSLLGPPVYQFSRNAEVQIIFCS